MKLLLVISILLVSGCSEYQLNVQEPINNPKNAIPTCVWNNNCPFSYINNIIPSQSNDMIDFRD